MRTTVTLQKHKKTVKEVPSLLEFILECFKT